HHRSDVVAADEAGGVQAVGAGFAVGDQPGDRVVQVVHAVEQVLGPGGEHHRVALVRRVGGRRNPLGGPLERVDRAGGGVVVLDRAAGGAGIAQQPHRLGDAGQVVG